MNEQGVGIVDDGIHPVDTTYTYADGLSVRVGEVQPYSLAGTGYTDGHRKGDDLVSCAVTVTNGTGRGFPLQGIELLIRCGAKGKLARRVHEPGSDLLDSDLEGTLRPGRTVSATWAHSIPPGTAEQLDIEVCFTYDDERDSVTFSTECGAAGAPMAAQSPRAAAVAARATLPDQAVLFGDEQRSLFSSGEDPAPTAPTPPDATTAVRRSTTVPALRASAGSDADADADAGTAVTVDADAMRVRQIFQFLAAAEESRTRPVRTLDGAQGAVWFADLPDDPAITSVLEGPVPASEPAWLTVERPQREEPPSLADRLAPWVDTERLRDFTSRQAPRLRRRIEPEAAPRTWGVALEKTYHELDEHPDRERIEKLYAAWEADWLTWAQRRREMEPLVKLYDRLHKLHEDATNLGESYELVLGFGRLTWQSTSGDRVERHLVTHRATLHLDPKTGTITAAPDRSLPGFRLEENMLDAEQHVQATVRDEIRASLELASDATETEHLDHVQTALRSWVNATHSAGRHLPGVDRVRPHTLDVPVVGFTPALVLRERTRRSTLEALRDIAGRIERGAEPTQLLRYIAGGDGALALTRREPGDSEAPGEVYFALPANEEQRTIAERLRGNRLVVVQGPPGTGKTHTIANLVTDLLAQGKRVLITSHTPRALRVLRDKLPDTIQDLCVSRTEDGTRAQRELEASVQTILTRYSGYDPDASRREIAQLEARLANARRSQEALLADLAALRDQETHHFPAEIGDYSGTLQRIAERLAAETEKHAWIGPVPQEQPALTPAEALRLLHAARAYGPEQRALAADVPGPAELPTPGDFDEAVAAVRAAEEAHAAVRDEPVAAAYDEAVSGLTEEAQQRLGLALDAFAQHRVGAAAKATVAGEWATAALGSVLAGDDWQVRSRHTAVQEALTAVDAALGTLGGAHVTGLEQYEPTVALSLATTLHDGLGQGQKLRGPLGIRTKLAKAVGPFTEQVRVDGRAPEDTGTAAKLLARVQLETHLARIESEYGTTAPPWQAHGPRVAALRQSRSVLDGLLAVGDARTEVVTAAATSPELVAAPWQERSTETAVRALLRVRQTLRAAEHSRTRIAAAAELLRTWTDRPGTVPAVTRAREAVAAQDPDAYREACEELAGVREAARLRAAHEAALTVVRDVFPSLAERIVETSHAPEWEARLGRLDEAWAWSAWRERIERLTDPEAERTLGAELAVADDEIRITLKKLAAARAWHGSLELLTGDQTTALKAYQQAVRRIKGKYQHRYRREAQTALREAQSAVPAWIMPLHQVAETVPMERPGIFDVVIVDEASQSGLEAMLLTWLAGRIVVVGDSKQVSPSNVGLKQEEYFQLQDRLLTGLSPARKGLFGPDTSFFDLTEALAGGRGTLMLKEHFRCMPEIIGFSNTLCYNNQLLPLRQYGADRLPPVRTVYVEDGVAEGNGAQMLNPAEAQALVDTVARCCEDPAYAGRTMGVISLRASKAHLQELENLLVTRLSYEEREERRIRVGDAEDFQGDERDIMFISCVNSATTAGGGVPGGYSGKTYEQRVNVAASRARDQVWVFHSARTDQFHENDLRRAYLDHLTAPAEEAVDAVTGEVLPDQRHEAFENLFQQRVYLELTRDGYRVRPQYRVGRHAIDLVVEGGTRRLAVECDGDSFAEGEDASTVAARQRDLERVDWTFVRIRGSRFHLDPNRAMAPLRAELERLGIEPVTAEPDEEPAPSPAQGPTVAAHRQPESQAGPRDVAPPVGEDPIPMGQEPFPGRLEVAAASSGDTEEQPPVDLSEGDGHGRREPLGGAEGSSADRPAGRAISREPLRQRRGPFPVRSVAPGCYQRVLGELRALQEALSAPDETPKDVDAANLAFLRKTQNDRRARFERRIAHLRSFLDSVDPEPEAGEPSVVVPGALFVLELDGEASEDLHTVAEVATGEEEHISPSSPLGAALMWQKAGHEVEYATGDGRTRRAVVRALRA